jgi:ParB-like chromosome segregation protein Spo0J
MSKGVKGPTGCGIVAIMNAKLKELIERVETWPAETQEEAIEILLSIEQARLADYELTDEDRAALARSAEDLREGRFAPDERVSEFFERNRRS